MHDDCVGGHTVYVYDRGGVQRLFQLPKVASVRWGRLRDDISEANVVLNLQQCMEQASILEQIEPMRHELVIYRGDFRVWEGPITLITETFTSVEIHAKDVMYYAYKTVMHAGYSNAYPNQGSVITRAVNILTTELARKEALTPAINVVPHIVPHSFPTDAKTTAVTLPYQYKVQEHIDNLAADAGLDYTVLGRAIHLWDTHRSLGRTQVATQNDFLGELTISRYGSELVTIAHVTDGRGQVGTAGANDPYYGEMESLFTAYDENTDDAPPSQAELDSQAARALVGANPVPLILRVPDNSSVNPKGILQVHDLVPGVYIPLRARLLVRDYQQMQKLDSMQVYETPDGEKITVTLSPAANSEEPA